jgi:SSS family solute:Na+ symporter/sodium/pantothenate symporter
VFAAASTALLVHFGVYYGEITMYHNNPAVPATFALVSSVLVALGVMTGQGRWTADLSAEAGEAATASSE